MKAARSQHNAAGSGQHPLETASGTKTAWRHLPCAHRRCLHGETVIWSEQLIPESISRGFFGHLLNSTPAPACRLDAEPLGREPQRARRSPAPRPAGRSGGKTPGRCLSSGRGCPRRRSRASCTAAVLASPARETWRGSPPEHDPSLVPLTAAPPNPLGPPRPRPSPHCSLTLSFPLLLSHS